jgi:hypothetical protein
MQSIGGKAAKIDSRFRIMLILWFAFLMSIGFLFVLTLIMRNPQRPESDSTVYTWTISMIGTIAAVVSILAKKYMINQAIKKQDMLVVFTGHIVAFGLTESAAVFALLLYMMTPGRAYIFLFIISAIVMLVHYPRRMHLMDASYKRQ